MTAKNPDRKRPEYPKRRVGRPEEITQEIIDKIVSSLRRGNYFETALASAGFNKTTGYEWLKRGEREPGSIYHEFSNAVRKAEADAEDGDVTVVEIHARGAKAQFDDKGNMVRKEVKRDVKVAQWRLERKYPKRWGRTDKFEHTGKDGGPLLTFSDWVKKNSNEEDE